ncbi:RAMP superfamily CRISPR-associated protein [Floridanema aerugineum]|uniref:RAMP superfamily CRISPR-associated protein n=1 Tax=Floridaenema aerugineum BLCC-F46 TaxID=3153654 RepID=A0ABV4XHV5_9CYAN
MTKHKKNQKQKGKSKAIKQQEQPLKQDRLIVENSSPSSLEIPSNSLKVKITLESDWHIGSGAGRPGDVDRLVQRDLNGLPYIPAKTLTGIWRDACELVALGLDNGNENGMWQQWVNYLFGEQPALAEVNLEHHPRPATVSVRSAHFPGEFVKAIVNKPILKDTLTFIKPGISIDPTTGCAREDCLRFEEVARGGAVLETICELNFYDVNEEQQKTAYALLLAGAKMVEKLGGKRRRGAGKCQFVINENKPWLDWLEDRVKNNSLAEPPKFCLGTDSASWDDTQATQQDGWVQVKLSIKTLSPVIIASRTIGNVVESLDYIPGTYLLPIVAKKLSKNLYCAIAQGDFIVTNATVEISGDRGRPVPLALFYEKVGGGWKERKGIYNRFQEKEPEEKQLKGSRQGYVSSMLENDLPTYQELTSGIAPHNTIKDEVQRPDKENGGIYNYQNIASGTTFQAHLRLKKELADYLGKDWWKSIEGQTKIGQSKKDDYGLVDIKAEPIKTDRKNQQAETLELVVWLLSDVLLRDNRLRPTTNIEDFRKALQEKLNQGLNLSEQIELQVKPDNEDTISAIARSRRTESWQVRWGLPRPSLVGLMAGSCIVFQVSKGRSDATKLAELEIAGIGERTAEGYGQICFNDPLLTKPVPKKSQHQKTGPKPDSNPSTTEMLSENDTDFDYARIIERAAWRDAIQKASLFLAKT